MIRVNSSRNPFDPLARLSHFEDPSGKATLGSVLPSWAQGNEQARSWINGVPVEEPATPLRDGDIVDVLEVPDGPIFGVGPGLAATGIVAASSAAAVSAFSFAGLFKLAGLFGLNFLFGQILAPRRAPTEPGDESSPTYRFGGIDSNPDAEGAPVPVVLGSMRTGGVVIGRYTRSSLTGTDLYTLLLLSEGPVTSIGELTADAGPLTSSAGNLPVGFQVNGQPADNFDGIEVHVRIGGLNQEAVPGFEASSKVEAVDQTLLDSSVPGPGLVTLTPQDGGFDPGNPTDQAELDKWDTAVAYTMPEDADEFVALIAFPQGLYESTPTGGIVVNTSEFQVRYQEVDGTGTPFGNVLVLPPEAVVSQSKTSPFEIEFRHPLFDVSSYLAPTAGFYLDLDASTKSASVPIVTGAPDVAADEVEWTFMGWVRPQAAINSLFTRGLFEWDNAGSNIGANAYIQFAQSLLPGGAEVRIVLNLGNGSTFTAYQSSVGAVNFSPTEWTHYAITYKGSDSEVGQGRLRFYINGALIDVIDVGASTHVLAPLESFDIGTDIGPHPNMNIDVDAVKLFERKLDTAEIVSQYNDGTGFGGTGSEPDLLVALLMDQEDAGSPNTTPDVSPNGNDADLIGGASITTGSDFGVVEGAGGGSYKRSRYRIEIQRLDTEETDPLEQNAADWESVRLVTWADFQYPGRALIGIRQRATDQLNGGLPTYTVPVEGPRSPVWDGASTEFPVATPVFNRNPAWLAALVATDKKWGLGDRYSFTDLDLAAFKEWADWCDEYVGDGLESIDVPDLTTADLVFTTTPDRVTLTMSPVTTLPDRWQVGYRLRIEGVDAEWDTPDGEGLEIVSVSFSAASSNLVVVAEWSPNMAAPDPTSIAATTGEIRGAEPRMRCDLVLDRREDSAPEVLDRIFSTGRGQRITTGSRLSVFVDKPAPPAALVTVATTVQGTLRTTYQSVADRPNVVEAEILDRDDEFRPARIEREHPTIQDPANFNGRRARRIALEGVTRRSQAMRDLLYQLNVFHLIRRSIDFDLPHIGIPRVPGDVVLVSHDVPQWGYSGKVRQADVLTGMIPVVGKRAGINASFIKEYAALTGVFRANLFTGSKGWLSEDDTGPKTGTNQNAIPIATNADAMPITVAPGQRIATLLFRDVLTPNVDSGPLPAVYKPGRYVVEWTEGSLTMEVAFDASGLQSLGTNRREFDVNTTTSAGIHFSIVACDNVKGLRMFRLEDEPYLSSEPWDPGFVEHMAPIPIVRWMEAQDINNDFDNGPPKPPGYLFWSEHGPPIEWMADFSNRYGKDCWACVPTYYLSANRRLFANRMHAALDPGLTWYAERANEYFNFIPYQDPPASGNWKLGTQAPSTHCFTVANDLQPHPTLPDTYVIGPGAIDPDPYIAHWMQWGRFSQELIDDIENSSDYTGSSKPRKHILGAQYVQANETSPGSGVWTGLTKTAMDECPGCDIVAGAPYNPGNPFDPAFDVDTQAADDILTAMEGNEASVFADMVDFVELVHQEGKDVGWYELGQQLIGGDPLNNQVLIDCQQDARIGAIMLRLLEKCVELAPESEPVFYASHTKGGTEGQFGAWRYPGQPMTEAPKAQALYEFIGTDDGGGPDPPDPPPGEENVDLYLDREVELSGDDEIVIESNATGERVTLAVLTGAGTVPADTLIVGVGILPFVPAGGDQYALGPVTKATKAFRLTSTEIDAKTKARRCSGPEYDEDVYDDDFGELDPPTSLLTPPSVAQFALLVPETALQPAATDATRQASGGEIVPEVALSWTLEPDTLPAVAAVEIYAANSRTAPRLLRTLPGQPTGATLALDGLNPDASVWVWIRPVNSRGEGRPVGSSARVPFDLLGLAPQPTAPTSLAANPSGQRVLYGWGHDQSEQVAGYELRRGGWILGQRVGLTGPGGVEFGPTFHFGTFSDDGDANGAYDLQVRPFLGNGQVGPEGSRSALDVAPNEIVYELHLQDDGATGWEGATLTGLTRDTPATGTGLTADGATSQPLIEFTTPPLRQSEECLFIVAWEAAQVYPDLGTDDGTPLGSRWTPEGPLWTYPGEISNATVRCAASYSTTDTAPGAPSTGYRPSPVSMKRARVLLRFSRSDLSLGITVKRMYVAIVRTNKPRIDQAEIAFLR